LEVNTPQLHQDIIDRCKTGDRQAYFKLYKLYSKSMFNVCYRMVRDEAAAEDVLQESFINAFKNLDNYRGDAAFGAWLKRIVVNKAITHIGKKKLEPFPDDAKFDIAEEVEIDEFAHVAITVERIKAAIMKLPDGYRTVLSLYLFEGYDHEEIGQVMGISESTSKSQFSRSKKKLLEILKQDEYE
jgi:RNA polymerase sigma factor (sigma-70 family)